MDCSTPGSSVLHCLWSLLKLTSIELVMLYNHPHHLLPPLLLPSVFPGNRVFSNDLALPIRWPKNWSFSIKPCNLRDSQESSLAPQFENISSLALSLLYDPTLTSIPDYKKNHTFDYTDLHQQTDISAF